LETQRWLDPGPRRGKEGTVRGPAVAGLPGLHEPFPSGERLWLELDPALFEKAWLLDLMSVVGRGVGFSLCLFHENAGL